MAAGRFDMPHLLAACAAVILVAFLVKLVTERRGDPEDEITAVLEHAATSHDRSYCTDDVTRRYLEQRSGFAGSDALAACLETVEDDIGLPDSIGVRRMAVSGDLATAEVLHHGGAFDGATLHYELLDDGDAWRIDQLTTIQNLDREAYVDFAAASFRIPPFSMSAEAIDCVIDSISESEARLVAEILDPHPLGATRVVVECDRPTVERLARETYSSDAYGLDSTTVDCVMRRIGAMSDPALSRLYADPPAQEALVSGCDG